MTYSSKIIVKENINFVKDKNKKLIEYEFNGNLGAWFISFEDKHVKAGDNRVIYNEMFIATKYILIRKNIFFKTYETWWIPHSLENSIESIARYYAKNLVRQLPIGSKLARN